MQLSNRLVQQKAAELKFMRTFTFAEALHFVVLKCEYT